MIFVNYTIETKDLVLAVAFCHRKQLISSWKSDFHNELPTKLGNKKLRWTKLLGCFLLHQEYQLLNIFLLVIYISYCKHLQNTCLIEWFIVRHKLLIPMKRWVSSWWTLYKTFDHLWMLTVFLKTKKNPRSNSKIQ